MDLMQQRLEENLVDQGGLPGAGHACDGYEDTEGNGDVEVIEVVLAGTENAQRVTRGLSTLLRDGDLALTRKILARD